MALPRVIPVLLLRNRGLVKSIQFKNYRYIGDPINAVKIFNEKEVDELILLDIDTSREGRDPDYEYLREIASECFMPLAYGGGVSDLGQVKRLIQSGIEKVIVNSVALANPEFVKSASEKFGSSTIVVAIDVKKNLFGKHYVYNHLKKSMLSMEPLEYAQKLRNLGAGEIFLNSVDLDGTMLGYDHRLVKTIADSIDIPVLACGGAGQLDDIFAVINESHAAAAAAGSFFIYYGKHRAVLITYPDYQLLVKNLK